MCLKQFGPCATSVKQIMTPKAPKSWMILNTLATFDLEMVLVPKDYNIFLLI